MSSIQEGDFFIIIFVIELGLEIEENKRHSSLLNSDAYIVAHHFAVNSLWNWSLELKKIIIHNVEY